MELYQPSLEPQYKYMYIIYFELSGEYKYMYSLWALARGGRYTPRT